MSHLKVKKCILSLVRVYISDSNEIQFMTYIGSSGF